MDSLRVGDKVRWAKHKHEDARSSRDHNEYFFVSKVSANGRCNLNHVQGGDIFGIPMSDLEVVQKHVLSSVTLISQDNRA